ncbi:MAG TPA: isoprenylcysteine carboxylmethyltransferase family protein [Terracidiphilus sp.]|jgi:protein-S-isoprenylcysteine O-methyltransferase Ste14|nr:isoprenylcysteine carboxylmethyltransferase family protein [Terracidiphilus sp.]
MTLTTLGKILYWCWFLSEIAILVFTRTRSGKGNVNDRGSLVLIWIMIVASLSVAPYYADTHPPTMFGGADWLRYVGLACMICGLAIRWTAVFSLGKSFSANVAILSRQQLKTGGLYRFVRHPSYFGLLLVILAIGIHTHNWIAFAICVVPPFLALSYRIHVEEAALKTAFGDEYAAYSRRTRRLIPGIY